MRMRSVLAAVTLTAAILIGGTGTAAAQSQPLTNGRCLVDKLLNNAVIGFLLPLSSRDPQLEAVDPCNTIVNNGSLQ
ncbi:hypothetical protein J7F01_36095 [Streptomyces sp. ISL-22]|uniref:hypothetical protein n=1 Tax=unclassified Streptomyces TaxID=2593676 RepID=UPI001BE7D829|nr:MULTISPECIES: hypothetical protein [unclassified Streptomyces]MBT2418481.1 hypothetical protein [Streptomyces sp. ISL-24]MBT2437484.1 hypothetical protein [Streptomyces sp. ISL-22]